MSSKTQMFFRLSSSILRVWLGPRVAPQGTKWPLHCQESHPDALMEGRRCAFSSSFLSLRARTLCPPDIPLHLIGPDYAMLSSSGITTVGWGHHDFIFPISPETHALILEQHWVLKTRTKAPGVGELQTLRGHQTYLCGHPWCLITCSLCCYIFPSFLTKEIFKYYLVLKMYSLQKHAELKYEKCPSQPFPISLPSSEGISLYFSVLFLSPWCICIYANVNTSRSFALIFTFLFHLATTLFPLSSRYLETYFIQFSGGMLSHRVDIPLLYILTSFLILCLIPRAYFSFYPQAFNTIFSCKVKVK